MVENKFFYVNNFQIFKWNGRTICAKLFYFCNVNIFVTTLLSFHWGLANIGGATFLTSVEVHCYLRLVD